MIELLIPFAILGGMDGVEPLRDSAPLRETYKMRGYVRKSMRRIRLAWCFDSALYAKGRAYNRMLKAKRTILRGGKYRPRFGYRIPDWAVKGETILNSSSQWMEINITPSQRAYARELAIERNK